MLRRSLRDTSRSVIFYSLLLVSLWVGDARSYELNVDDPASIYDIAQHAAYKMMQFYPGNQTGGIPGLFGDPYYWWEAGAAFGALIDYWFYFGDAGYVPVTMEAMMHQVGPDSNYMPPNQTKSLGNDDQGFWGLAAMSAAEKRFPNPPADQPQWLALAQGVFNSQALRWDTTTCNGGLRWQIYTFNNGYQYKNTVSNGCFFQLAARLARYTGNATYAQWAERTFDWTRQAGFATENWAFFDGAGTSENCSVIDKIQWSYNAGLYLAGAAYMYNYTDGSDLWRERVQGILNMTQVFFTTDTSGNPNVMYEVACEPYNTCNVDQRSFKAYLSRFMALTLKMAPWTSDFILPRLQSSAVAAARHCSFGADHNTCGLKWTQTEDDGYFGVGEQMAALEVVQSLLAYEKPQPVTEDVGGISPGDPGAGTGTKASEGKVWDMQTKTGDKVGAAFATIIVLVALGTVGYWMA
ncbi:hypothetical protein RUND412_004840 [Rhizina undulata]